MTTADHDLQFSTTVILDKVRKLLAKAEDPACSPAEAEACNAKAAALLAKYGVERSMLAGTDPNAHVVGDKLITLRPPFALDKGELLSQIAQALGMRIVRMKAADRNGFTYHLFGTTADLDRLDVLFTSLLVQQSRFLAREQVPLGVDSRVFRRSWLRHYADEIYRMLREREQYAARQAEQGRTDGPSVALALISKRDKVDRRLAEIYPKLRKGNLIRRGVGAGGRTAARQSDLGGARVGRTYGALGS